MNLSARCRKSDKEYLKTQLAVAIFKSAESGDRDYERLKQSAIEAVSAVPSFVQTSDCYSLTGERAHATGLDPPTEASRPVVP